ncbi:MAG TPA: DNA-formamidopyrimidine glycosylase family protein [Gemmatimonadaceae bacterium]|nr:DNA-formamidopyrimidine glycosylase family protein [Gemmatimonadaceae bacterium]
MPELPEVERAVVELRRHIVGRRIVSLDIHHPSLRRRITPAQRRSVRGARIVAVRRRGKHQLIDLDDGRVLHAHFRMTGDWAAGPAAAGARYARATIALDDGSAVVLDDPRALSSIVLVAAGADSIAGLGPDADDPGVDARWLGERFAKRRAPIKVVLLDQAVLSGIGNIYASEALWHSRLDPRRPAADLTPVEVRRLLSSIRKVLKRASGARYAEGGRFDVYDRAGKKCRRCSGTIDRLAQAGRSTYFCPKCQH